MKVVIYARVSTADQADNGVSLQAQREKLTAYAALFDHEVVCTIEDAGESAKSLKRPGIQQALQMLKNGQAEGLLIAKLDRLTRNISDWQHLIDNYFGERAGKQLLSLTDSINTTTAAGRMALNMLLVVSQWEREVISERTVESMAHKRRKGQRLGTIPFGWTLGSDRVQLVENITEQESICLMRSLREGGCSFAKIAKELSSRGVRTKSGGTTWVHTAVRSILNRPVAKAVA